ncbi:MAG: nitrilase-related carbon-nitrogen hydrolase [Candidatus Thorarchaeota archaeon]
MEFKVTLVQMSCTEGRPDENYRRALTLLREHRPVCDREFVLLPELFAIGFNPEDYKRIGPDVPSLTRGFLSDLAREHRAYVIATGVEPVSERFYNTLLVMSPGGEEVARYRKIHPFQNEREVFVGGDRLVLFEAAGLKVGVEICYDLRFPEVTRRLALEGAQLVLVPAAFPEPRSSHWDVLIRARAIENQLFMACCNRVGGAFDGKRYFGHSNIIDPWGVRMVEERSDECLLAASCDTSATETARETITCFADRVEDAYGRVEWFRG